jgi:hypothetical protein
MVIGLVALASVGAAACHNSGPPGDMGNQGGMGNDPMNPMYRAHAQACAHATQPDASCTAPQSR